MSIVYGSYKLCKMVGILAHLYNVPSILQITMIQDINKLLQNNVQRI